MKKNIAGSFRISFFCMIFFFSAGLSALPPLEPGKIDLTEKRTEFTTLGQYLDHFFNSYQAKILHSFAQSAKHFTLIFETAKKEGIQKADEAISQAGNEAISIVKEQAKKNITQKLEKELKNLSPAAPEKKEQQKEEKNTLSSAQKNPVQKMQNADTGKKRAKRDLPEKKKTLPEWKLPEIPELPRLPEDP